VRDRHRFRRIDCPLMPTRPLGSALPLLLPLLCAESEELACERARSASFEPHTPIGDETPSSLLTDIAFSSGRPYSAGSLWRRHAKRERDLQNEFQCVMVAATRGGLEELFSASVPRVRVSGCRRTRG
jgi:hypothetical protein